VEHVLRSRTHVSLRIFGVKALGAYIRIRNGRYLAGFAVVEDDQLVLQQSYPAPADETDAGQLGELYGRTGDVIASASPDLFALKVSEIARTSTNAVIAHRAEGVLLAAAGRQRSLGISSWSGQRLWKPAGFASPAKTKESIDALCGRLAQVPNGDEVRQAAAAAAAALGVGA
jgi:Holliday junction resolvasome RuvABC endonuclease subunit